MPKRHIPPAVNVVLSKEEQLPLLNMLIEECGVTLEMCERCKKCGIDTGPEMAKVQDQLAFANGTKAEFFPDET
jgi:hypothetical protein